MIAHKVGTFINTINTTNNSQMKTLYDIFNNIESTEERIKFCIRNHRYAIIRKGVKIKTFPFKTNAIKYKVRNDSALFNDILEIVDLWTGENIRI